MSSGLAGVESAFVEDAFGLEAGTERRHHAPKGFPIRHPDLAEVVPRLPPKIELALPVLLRFLEQRAAALLDLVDREGQQA